MKKSIFLTLPFLLLTVLCFGQKGKQSYPKYYSITVEYMASDKCMHGNTLSQEIFTGSPDFDEIYKGISDYIKPYKVIRKTFKIIEMIQSTKNDFKHAHHVKFKPCCKAPVKFNSGALTATTATDTNFFVSSHSTGLTLQGFKPQLYNLVYKGVSDSFVTFSNPDSTNTVTMKIHGLTKINDSTYTFKQLK